MTGSARSEGSFPGAIGLPPGTCRYLRRMAANLTEALDATDWALLSHLQRDGRLTMTELGRRVNLSSSATTERVRRLEESGVITGYRADVDLARLGRPILAVVRLKYPGSRHQTLHRLLSERMEILECLRVTGEECYVFKVVAMSMAHLEQVVDLLAQFGNVTTSIVYSPTLPYRGLEGPLHATS